MRWSIEPSNANGKQQASVGQARNRLPRAVERTVPFGMIVQSMVITWYALYGYDPADAARFTTVTPGQPDPDLLHDYALACAAAAA